MIERIEQFLLALGGHPDQAIHVVSNHLPENGLLDLRVIASGGKQQLAAAVIEQLADVVCQGGVVGVEQVGDQQADRVAALLAQASSAQVRLVVQRFGSIEHPLADFFG